MLPILPLMIVATALAADPAPVGLLHARYRVLPGEAGTPPPFNSADFAYGPASATEGLGRATAWQLTVSEQMREQDTPKPAPLFQLRAVTTRDPLNGSLEPLTFLRYQLTLPETAEALEFRNVHTGNALLPAWGDFGSLFFPQPARGTGRYQGFPSTCEYLGHVLTLERVGKDADWPEREKLKILQLDPELFIGTSRSTRDQEGHRLPQKPELHEYHYIPLMAEDYRARIDAGMNLFWIPPGQEELVRDEPVFYLRGAGGKPPLRYPADLYRSNYVGNDMFIDEPTSIMVADKRVHVALKYFTDAAALITKRARAAYQGSRGAEYSLERELAARGVGLGDMRLANTNVPAWETVYETAYYQLAGGLAGFVHEGRYQLDEFNANANASTGLDRVYTAEEMFRYIYAFMRGAARHFGKDWGTSIYGQADPKLSPLAMRLAYDMGARYLWYWTSDHDHHLPWPEQIELTRTIRQHVKTHERPSIRAARPMIDKLILIPYGYFLTLESPTGRKQSYDLWWVRELDPEGRNESSQTYRRLIRHAFVEIQKAFDVREDFDICVDDGKEIDGYRHIVRLKID